MIDKYDISICVPGMPFDGETLDKKSLGGSETAGVCVARELACLGHRVKVFSNCENEGRFDEVQYHHINSWQAYVTTTQHDIAIGQRTPDAFLNRNAARLNFLWCHDLPLGRQADKFRATMWNIDKVIVLSSFMKEQYSRIYNLPETVLFQSRNGIDLNRFPNVKNFKRNRKRLVYSARPERGLDVLIDRILPKLFELDPEIEVALFGYDNPVDHLSQFYNELADKLRVFGDKVKFIGQLSKPDLYREYCKSGIYTYPTPSPRMESFSEISCIGLMEAQASGMPVVSSSRGALPETLAKGAGKLILGDSMSDEYRDKFVEAVLSYINDEELYNKASAVGQKHAQTLGWDGVAEQFSEAFDHLFGELNDDKTRLAYHFYRRSDIFAAKHVLKKTKTLAARSLQSKIDREYAFTKSKKAFANHYKKAGQETDKRLEKYPLNVHDFQNTRENRFRAIQNYLETKPELEKILDFGCGHGWSTIYLHNKIGRSWVGVDIDPGAIKWARKFAKFHGQKPSAMKFIHGDEDTDLSKYGPFDCIIVSEVLEHCIDPVSVMNKLEKWAKEGAIIIITVPYGPSEYGTPNWEKFRNHLWEFDLHDIDDMFGKKKSMIVNDSVDHSNPKTGEAVGYHFLIYIADGTPVNSIDWQRKLRLQRPRQTVSASLIAGPNCEETLRWCLNSVRWIADEIVIADTGMNAEARAMAESYEARLVKGSDPIQAGFEVPRNESLKECRMDWVLWIDTDEKLIGVEFLTKYTRRNLWNGLSIRQHHFTVDTEFKADMPVRMFRNAPCNGKRMRFWGQIHEHPELGINKGPGEVIILPDVHIAHVGYLVESARRIRFQRNFPLLQRDIKKYPNRLLQKHFIIRDNSLLNMYEMQQNGGRITDEIKKRAEETVELYRKYFLGKSQYANIDALDYYTQALRILGRGFECSFSFAANRDGVGDQLDARGVPMDGGLSVARFDSIEEAEKEISHRLKKKVEPLNKEQW